MTFPYDKLSKHIFNWPNREECLHEWYRVYGQMPFYTRGVELINHFFTMALKSELNRLMSNL